MSRCSQLKTISSSILRFLKINTQKTAQHFTLLIYSSICLQFVLFYTTKKEHTQTHRNTMNILLAFELSNIKKDTDNDHGPWTLFSFQRLFFVYNELKWEPIEMLETIATEKTTNGTGKKAWSVVSRFCCCHSIFRCAFIDWRRQFGFVYLWVNVRMSVYLYAHSVIHNEWCHI